MDRMVRGVVGLPTLADPAVEAPDLPLDVSAAIVVDPSLGVGRIANAASVVAIGLGAASPVLAGRQLVDAAGLVSYAISLVPVPILQAGPDGFATLVGRALPAPDACYVILFPSYAAAIQDARVYLAETAGRHFKAEVYTAVGLAGPKKWLRSLTGSLKLL